MRRRPTGYNVHTESDIQAMLVSIGAASVEDLFADIPSSVRLDRDLQLPRQMNEWELMQDVRGLGAMNSTTKTHACYLGSGAYEHYIPAVVDAIVSRGEFLTAYTPYQPEMSQGLLQALFEFQVLIGRLVGRECVNCSVYDGATALAEACWMMCSASGKRRVIVPHALWANYHDVLKTYLHPRGVRIDYVPAFNDSGLLNLEELSDLLIQGDIAGVVIQSPNAFGVIEDVAKVADICLQQGALLCASVNPILCGLVEPPGILGADIVVCEGQPLGLPLNAGGPYVGIIACSKSLERFLPGRLVGRVHDLNGRLAYALVKEDREQHVARDKATSHICSNQALNALRVAVYLACLGEQNFMVIAQANALNAQNLHASLLRLPGVKSLRTGAFFNEFSLELPVPAQAFCAAMLKQGIMAGVPVPKNLAGHEHGLIVAVTETKSAADIATYVSRANQCLADF